MLPLKILTLNVAGMADPDKRALLFRFLRDHPAHVICLQEVHAPDDCDFWSVHWGGPASWNWNTAILLSPSLGKPQFDVSYEGRVLAATFRFQGQVYKIANIYAHADRSARRHFFDQLSASADFFSSFDFLVGDWNSYPDPLRDRVSISPPQAYQTWPHLLPVLAPFSDAAFAGAAAPYHTFHKKNRNGLPMHSRLDHIFMNVRHTSFTPTTVLHPFPRSDHEAVHVTFTTPSFSRPLLWRYNTSLLSSPDLRASTISRLLPYRSPTLWDATKDITRSHAQDFAVVSARRRQSDRCRLERQLSSAYRRAARDVTDSQAATDVLDLRSQLDDCLEQETSRATLRARVRWLEEGETCSAYFFSRFRSRSSSSTLSLLRDSDGSPFPSDSARRTHIQQYFTSLCAAPPFYPPDCHSFLASITLPALSPALSSSLLVPFTADELLSTIKALPLRRAPGPDGIPYEWYQTFADSLIPILLPLFNSVLSGGPAPPSWSRTLVSLIPKPGRDLSSIANWRPITLANCDVKIFSRLLASRLASVLPTLVSSHQAGFTKDRNAADVAMAVRNVLGYAADEAVATNRPVDGALVFLDQEKAYDRISHPYLSAVLTKFGFPPLVQHAFAVTYTNTSAFFMDDGHPVGPVSVACGVRQGDPLAPLLFNLAFEPLLVALRTRLQGIRLPWGVFITGAYADDATIGIALSDGRVFILTLREYCRASNSRINFTKSRYMPLSSTVHSLPQWASDLGLVFHNPLTPIRVLGYDLVLSPDGVQENWTALYNQLETVSQDILSRRLTLQGRSLCVTSLLFSRLWYKFRLSTPSTTQLNKFTRLGWRTVWNDHPGIAPPRTLVVVPASLVVSTSSLLWLRQRLCRLNGSAPFSLVTLSGPPLFNTSCANNLEVRFFWPPPCVSTPFGGILFAGGPSYKPGRNFVLTGILTLQLGRSPRHCRLFLRARTLPVTYLVFLWCSCSSPIRPVPTLRLFRTPPLVFVLAGKLLVGSVMLLTIFAPPRPLLLPNLSILFALNLSLFPAPLPRMPLSCTFWPRIPLFLPLPLPRPVVFWMAWTVSPLPWIGMSVPFLVWVFLRRTSGNAFGARRFSLGTVRPGTSFFSMRFLLATVSFLLPPKNFFVMLVRRSRLSVILSMTVL